MPRHARDPAARRAALAMLAKGLGSPGEVADLAGVSRQLVEAWARHAGIDWRRIKRAKLVETWRKEMRRGQGSRLVETE